MCWVSGGSHRTAGIIAGVTLALFCIAMPIFVIAWQWKDPWLRRECSVVGERSAAVRDKDEGMSLSLNPMFAEPRALNLSSTNGTGDYTTTDTGTQSKTIQVSTAHVSDSKSTSIVAQPDPLLAPFHADYRPVAWFIKHFDLLFLAFLSCINAFIGRPTTVLLITSKAAAICSASFALCICILVVKPYPPHDAWKLWVRVSLLLLGAAGAVITAATSALDLELGGAFLRVFVTVFAYVILSLCCATGMLLLGGFYWTIVDGARAEKRAQEDTTRAAEERRRRSVWTSERKVNVGGSEGLSRR